MNCEIIRIEETIDGVIGVLLVDSDILCFTLEPDKDDETRYQVPEGEYKCHRFHGSQYKNTFEINVEGHTAILFHWGNIEENTMACVLLGMRVGNLKGKRAVLSSKAAFKAFMKRMEKHKEFSLKIRRA